MTDKKIEVKGKSRSRKKDIPIDAVQELADKASQSASIGGTEEDATAQSNSKIQVDADFLRTTKVHCAMPCYGGMLTESTFMSFIKFSSICRQLGIDWTLETIVNESLISRARNTLTAKFLDHESSTHLMFIDADIGWEAWHLLVLLNRNVDVIGGLYPMKSLPLKWVVNGFDGAETGPNELQEVSKAGTGFLLTKRHVFQKLISHPAVKPYKNDIELNPAYDKYLRTYFDTAVRQGRYYSEDWTFCENWRDLGGKIWVDKRVLLKHTGTYTYSQENQDILLNTIGPMYVEALEKQGKSVKLS